MVQSAYADGPINEALLQNVDDKTTVTLSGFRYNRRTRTYFGSATITNTSNESLPKPMYLVVNAITPDSVNVANHNGLTVSSKPYYDMSALIPGEALAPGAVTNPLTMELTNPNGVQFQMDLSVYIPGASVPNALPVIISTPVSTGTEGIAYSYGVEATDADNDPLTYSITAYPDGMTVDTTTGLVSWTPTATQSGDHGVTVMVSDGRGGTDTQSYVINVAEALNVPPVITSSPVTVGVEGAPYTYDVEATDADNDPLTYSITACPDGMTVDATTGLVSWTPSSIQSGSHSVAVEVSDGRGGFANQSFSVDVAEAINNPPVITSTPVVSGTEGVPYEYDVEAVDPDGDVLTFALMDAPDGMIINANTGLIHWTPPQQMGSFTEVGASAGVNASGEYRGVAWGDYDNDGDLDLYVGYFGGGGGSNFTGGPNLPLTRTWVMC